MKFGKKLFQAKLLSRLSHKVCRLLSSPVLLRKFTIKLAEFGTRQKVFSSLEKKRRAREKRNGRTLCFRPYEMKRESQKVWWVALRLRFEVKNDHFPRPPRSELS